MAGVRGIVTIAMVGALCAAPAAAAAGLDDKAAAQIAALQALKGSLSEGRAQARQPARRRAASGGRAARSRRRAATGVEVSTAGATEVDVRAAR